MCFWISRIESNTLHEAIVSRDSIASTETRHTHSHSLVDERIGMGHPYLQEGERGRWSGWVGERGEEGEEEVEMEGAGGLVVVVDIFVINEGVNDLPESCLDVEGHQWSAGRAKQGEQLTST